MILGDFAAIVLWIAPEDAHIAAFDVALRPGFLRSSADSIRLAGEFRHTAVVYYTNAELVGAAVDGLELDEFGFGDAFDDALLAAVFAETDFI